MGFGLAEKYASIDSYLQNRALHLLELNISIWWSVCEEPIVWKCYNSNHILVKIEENVQEVNFTKTGFKYSEQETIYHVR